MRNMIDKGNSVIVIEHNLDFIIDSAKKLINHKMKRRTYELYK